MPDDTVGIGFGRRKTSFARSLKTFDCPVNCVSIRMPPIQRQPSVWVAKHGVPDGSVVSVPPGFTRDAVFEAIENGIRLIVIVTENIPRREVAQMVELAHLRGARIIGPNCLGLISPGEAKMGGVLNNWRGFPQGLFLLMVPIMAYTVMHHPDFSDLTAWIQTRLSGVESEPIRSQLRTPLMLTRLLPAGGLRSTSSIRRQSGKR